jgi:hypothetical protein
MKFDNGKLYENLLTHFVFHLYWKILMTVLHEDLHSFLDSP